MKSYVPCRFLVLMLQMIVSLPFAHPARVDAQAANADPANLVVQSEGSVKVKRPGWTAYAPVVFGTGLQPGDLLNLGESSHAKVVCSDLTLHEVRTGVDAVPCISSLAVLRRANGSLIHTTRGWPNDGSYPTVVQPRKTKLLSAHPTLRWTAVKGATGYSILIRGEDLLWSIAVPAVTQFVYPDNAPQLKPGVDYKLIVVASNSVSSDEPGLGLGFSLLASADAKAVLHEQKQIENLGLPQGPTDYLIAYLYANHHLYAEAIERLEEASEKFKVAAVQRLLGDLYMDIGLARQAEAHYLNSLDLSRAENDEEGQMVVHQALAYIYLQILGNKETASHQLSATLELAKKLGDDLTASQAGKQLAELQKTGT
jgi:hypothetical protein